MSLSLKLILKTSDFVKITHYFLIILFTDFWVCWLSSSSGEQAARSSCSAWSSHAIQCVDVLLRSMHQGRLGSSSWGPQLQSTDSTAVAPRLSCSSACGLFPGWGSNWCLPRWQADSWPLSHQGSPKPLTLAVTPVLWMLRDVITGWIYTPFSGLQERNTSSGLL